jgi:hypothetical protein
MPRDRSPFVRVDAESGLASAGGYTGDGVVLARVAGQTLADAIVTPGADTAFTRLPFFQHAGRRWECEPARWLGINAGLNLATMADRREGQGRTSRAAALLDRLLG